MSFKPSRPLKLQSERHEMIGEKYQAYHKPMTVNMHAYMDTDDVKALWSMQSESHMPGLH